jgi:hypothetical protein
MSVSKFPTHGDRPSPWAVSILMFSIAAAVLAVGLLGAELGLL